MRRDQLLYTDPVPIRPIRLAEPLCLPNGSCMTAMMMMMLMMLMMMVEADVMEASSWWFMPSSLHIAYRLIQKANGF